jgi:hypothetical protein
MRDLKKSLEDLKVLVGRMDVEGDRIVIPSFLMPLPRPDPRAVCKETLTLDEAKQFFKDLGKDLGLLS